MQYFGYLRAHANSLPTTDFTRLQLLAEQAEHLRCSYQNAEMVKAFLLASEYRGRFPK